LSGNPRCFSPLDMQHAVEAKSKSGGSRRNRAASSVFGFVYRGLVHSPEALKSSYMGEYTLELQNGRFAFFARDRVHRSTVTYAVAELCQLAKFHCCCLFVCESPYEKISETFAENLALQISQIAILKTRRPPRIIFQPTAMTCPRKASSTL